MASIFLMSLYPNEVSKMGAPPFPKMLFKGCYRIFKIFNLIEFSTERLNNYMPACLHDVFRLAQLNNG